MTVAHQLFTGIAVLAAGVIYGTDVFCATVQRSALGRIDDRSLTRVMGFVHFYGDKRLPVAGAVSVIATALAAITAVLNGGALAIGAGATAVVLMGCWLALYLWVSVPVNRQLTAAAREGRTPLDARELQARWDSVINARAVLQGLAVAALFVGGVAG
ncbi:DUF1772 domain-containing protein [Streptomyces sp. NPDC057638]|uniref:DUF1772 domain-containing protein n=1 Tax=Streptomyces sp. NPDC057638 TaxID=3346190 RepID=UPI00368293C4